MLLLSRVDDDVSDSPGAGDRCLGRRAGPEGLRLEIVPAAGRPAYHTATPLKLYIFGYLDRVQSSRRLERDPQRNVELMWLTGKLATDHKTIAKSRKDDGEAVPAARLHFIALCREIGLFTQAEAAVDGSKFKAMNTRGKNFTPAELMKRMEQVEEHIAGYLQELDTADWLEGEAVEARAMRLKDKIATLRDQMQALKVMGAQVEASPEGQVSLTDPDARSMAPLVAAAAASSAATCRTWSTPSTTGSPHTT